MAEINVLWLWCMVNTVKLSCSFLPDCACIDDVHLSVSQQFKV